MTQAELAAALDVDRSTVAKWEAGVATPRVKNLTRLAQITGVPVQKILGYSIDDNQDDKEEAQHVSA